MIEDHRVSILIGSDRPDIIGDNSEIRGGARGQPYAVNTPFRWTVYGPMGGPDSDGVHVNFVRNDHEEMLSKQLEHFYNAEFRDTLVDVEQSLSLETEERSRSWTNRWYLSMATINSSCHSDKVLPTFQIASQKLKRDCTG